VRALSSNSLVRPSNSRRPISIITSQSQICSSSASTWEETTTERSGLASRPSTLRISALPTGSSPFVGSSSSSRWGSPSSAAAIPSRCFMPVRDRSALRGSPAMQPDAPAGRRTPRSADQSQHHQDAPRQPHEQARRPELRGARHVGLRDEPRQALSHRQARESSAVWLIACGTPTTQAARRGLSGGQAVNVAVSKWSARRS
jgi:hypothetical protein